MIRNTTTFPIPKQAAEKQSDDDGDSEDSQDSEESVCIVSHLANAFADDHEPRRWSRNLPKNQQVTKNPKRRERIPMHPRSHYLLTCSIPKTRGKKSRETIQVQS